MCGGVRDSTLGVSEMFIDLGDGLCGLLERQFGGERQ